MITIIDYGVGNLGSICNMYRHLGIEAVATKDPADLKDATRIILPGVGAFDAGISALRSRGFEPALAQKVKEGSYVLGICLGMQLLSDSSEEGQLPGLGYIKARFTRFPETWDNQPLRVPHVGWRLVTSTRPHPLFENMPEAARFYFVHSYRAECEQANDVILTASHGFAFPAAYGIGRVAGVQFHPEKSHRFGMAVLRNFAHWL